MSQGTGPAFFADPKGLERQVVRVPACCLGSPGSEGIHLVVYGSADRVRAGEMRDPELREDDVRSRFTPLA